MKAEIAPSVPLEPETQAGQPALGPVSPDQLTGLDALDNLLDGGREAPAHGQHRRAKQTPGEWSAATIIDREKPAAAEHAAYHHPEAAVGVPRTAAQTGSEAAAWSQPTYHQSKSEYVGRHRRPSPEAGPQSPDRFMVRAAVRIADIAGNLSSRAQSFAQSTAERRTARQVAGETFAKVSGAVGEKVSFGRTLAGKFGRRIVSEIKRTGSDIVENVKEDFGPTIEDIRQGWQKRAAAAQERKAARAQRWEQRRTAAKQAGKTMLEGAGLMFVVPAVVAGKGARAAGRAAKDALIDTAVIGASAAASGVGSVRQAARNHIETNRQEWHTARAEALTKKATKHAGKLKAQAPEAEPAAEQPQTSENESN